MFTKWIYQTFERYSLFVVALLFLPATAIAATWTLILADDHQEVEVDTQSVRPNKAAWFKYFYTPPMSDSCGMGKKTAYVMNYVAANCREFTLQYKKTIAYTVDGEVLTSCSYDAPKEPFTEYAPETVGEFYFNAICHPWGRIENSYAVSARNRKIAAALASKEARRKAEADQERANQIRLEANNKLFPGKQPEGASCSTSSDCAGLLICARINQMQMRCMTSDAAIKLNSIQSAE